MIDDGNGSSAPRVLRAGSGVMLRFARLEIDARPRVERFVIATCEVEIRHCETIAVLYVSRATVFAVSWRSLDSAKRRK